MELSIIRNANRVEHLPESTPTERHTVHHSPKRDTCSLFIAIIAEVYPQLQNSIQYRLCKKEKWLTLRAKHGRRRIFASGSNHTKTMNDFMHQCLTKLN